MLTARALLKLMHFSGVFAAHRATWSMRLIGANPAAALQIDGRSRAPSAADFLAMFMQEIGALGAKSEVGILGKRGGFSEGKIKEDGTM